MSKKSIFVDPLTKTNLILISGNKKKNVSEPTFYMNNDGTEYQIINEIPDFRIKNRNYDYLNYYDENASTYDDYNHLTFELQGFDEFLVRRYVISKLNISKKDKILEIGCGTGRDSVLINEKLGIKGELFLADISQQMIEKCKKKLKGSLAKTYFILADALYLPFPDNYFDKTFSFVTMPAIGNDEDFLKEITRVTKPKGKVLIGSEGLIPSLKNTEFGKLITNNCKLYKRNVPLEKIPSIAGNIKIEWILNGIIFLLEYDVMDNEPRVSDIEIPGRRGGTLYTRYFGEIEGIKPETKKIACEAIKISGKSSFNWLNEIILKAAKEELAND